MLSLFYDIFMTVPISMSARIIRPDDVNTFICILQISCDNDCINLVLVL